VAPGIDWQSGRHQPTFAFGRHGLSGPGAAQNGRGPTDRRGMRLPTRARRADDDAAHRYGEWRRVHSGLARFVEETWSFRGLPTGSGGDRPVLRNGERPFLALDGVHLIEPRHRGGRYVGGLVFPGFEEPTSIDVGTLWVTQHRAVLYGRAGGEPHEWLFANVTALHHEPDAPWTALVVSDRPAVSGIFYGHADVDLVRFRLSLALAVDRGTVGELRAELQRRLRDHRATRPPAPGP
jgi:hypothetical protein